MVQPAPSVVHQPALHPHGHRPPVGRRSASAWRLLSAATALVLVAACGADAPAPGALPAAAPVPPLSQGDQARIAASIPADGADSSVPSAARVFADEALRSAAASTPPPAAFEAGTRQPAMTVAQESAQMPMPGQANDHSVAGTGARPASAPR